MCGQGSHTHPCPSVPSARPTGPDRVPPRPFKLNPHPIPPHCHRPQIGSVHHEVELAVVVDKRARRVPEGQALEHVGGYALAIDLTARDLQAEAKKVGMGLG